MPKGKPVYQYDMYGNFIREFSSITEASKEVDGGRTNIRDVCKGKYQTSYGFQWRYKDEIEDADKKIGLGNYSVDKEVKKLHEIWYKIIYNCYDEKGRYFEDDLEVCEEWRESFDNFYYDNIERYRRAHKMIPDYKKDLSNTHIWFSRKNKNKGWNLKNTEFTTPDFTMRSKDETIKVIKDGRTLTVSQIEEELRAKGISISVASIRKRLKENRGIEKPNYQAKYLFNGSYYSLVELADILDFDYQYVKARINKRDENLFEAIRSYQEFKGYSFNGEDELTYSEYVDKLVKASGLPRTTVNYRLRAGYSEREIINIPIEGRKGVSHRIAVAQYKNGKCIDTFSSMSEASEKTGISLSAISDAVRNGFKRRGYYFKRNAEEAGKNDKKV